MDFFIPPNGPRSLCLFYIFAEPNTKEVNMEVSKLDTGKALREAEVHIESNPELELAWQLVEYTGVNVFLTGKAGSGKTTFLRSLRERSSKRMVVLAPTGVAAMNAGGVTIHSFFQLPFAPFVPESHFGGEAQYQYRFGKEKLSILRSIDLLVIDEISMVRADLLDAVDDVLRRYRDRYKPFGGVQLLMIGDLQQLAPVVKEQDQQLLSPYYDHFYFFGSRALQESGYVTVELTKVYRQSNAEFLDLLNCIRDNRVNASVLERLNRRCLPDFAAEQPRGYIYLTTHNQKANDLNTGRLERLPGKPYVFRAETDGDFPAYMYPTEEELVLKAGAQVMFVKNDISGQHRYYNGMLGRIVSLSDEGPVEVEAEDGQVIALDREEWTNCKYSLDSETKEITETILGTFRQYPLRLAWAITIHKSQGLTFDKAIIDVRQAFAPGQAYVALSRCRSLEGLVLSAPVQASSILSDAVVTDFVSHIPQQIPDAVRISALQQAYFEDQVAGLFGFARLSRLLQAYIRLLDEHLYRLYPQLLTALKAQAEGPVKELDAVGQKFIVQCRRLVATSTDYANDAYLQQRFHAAAVYLRQPVAALLSLLEDNPVTTDNKNLKKRVDEALDGLLMEVRLKDGLLAWIEEHGFVVADYLTRKNRLIIDLSEAPKSPRRKSAKEKKAEVPQDILHPALFESLRAWRASKAAELGLPAYTVLQQKALLGITNLLPDSTVRLLAIPYMGKKSVEKYGEELLRLVEEFRNRKDGGQDVSSL